MRRQLALAIVAFGSTLILLAGLVSVIGRADATPSPATASPPSSVPATATPMPATPSPSASASPSASGSAVASPSASGPIEDQVLVGAGDIATCPGSGDEATADLVAAIEGTVFTAGDNAYENGSPDDFRDCYGPSWGRFLDRTRPAAGNHDWVTGGAAGYLGYFGSRASPNGTTWYSYDLGAWHVVVLDSDCAKVDGCGPDSAQGRWLASDLATSHATCTLAVWHHPRFSSGVHGSDRSVAPFWDALYAAGADLVINGHDHDYERFAPQDPAGHEDRARGMREFVVGTGGAELRTFPVALPNSELRVSLTTGVIKLTLHRTSYDWSFIPTGTDFSDSGSAPCH